jgi:hypothetical protein
MSFKLLPRLLLVHPTDLSYVAGMSARRGWAAHRPELIEAPQPTRRRPTRTGKSAFGLGSHAAKSEPTALGCSLLPCGFDFLDSSKFPSLNFAPEPSSHPRTSERPDDFQPISPASPVALRELSLEHALQWKQLARLAMSSASATPSVGQWPPRRPSKRSVSWPPNCRLCVPHGHARADPGPSATEAAQWHLHHT